MLRKPAAGVVFTPTATLEIREINPRALVLNKQQLTVA